MNKVICDVCGTSYPETATQCPICGCVRPADAAVVADDGASSRAAGTYQYVKGGRFSKSNVRKRNAGKQAPVRNSTDKPVKKSGKNGKDTANKGLIITIFVLLLAILLVVGYIIIKFFIPTNPVNEASELTPPAVEYEAEPSTDPEIICEGIELDTSEVYLYEIGEQLVLNAVLTPADTTEDLLFATSDEAVATVDEAGNITAINYGEAMITVSCGSTVAECVVTVAEPLVIDIDNIIFENAGTAHAIYSGELPLDEITWTSDNEQVAVVADGVVTAVGEGTAVVQGTYKGQTVLCSVSCEFNAESDTNTETVAGTAPGPYTLKNIIGVSSTDVSLSVGESFILALLDANGEEISDVTWSIENGSCCVVNDGTVKAVASGSAEVVASYNGETFRCLVRVY